MTTAGSRSPPNLLDPRRCALNTANFGVSPRGPPPGEHHYTFFFGHASASARLHGDRNIKIYLNGALSGTGDSQASVSDSARPISIDALYTDDMVGFVDEVAVWPIALSAQNVQTIYNGGSPFNLTTDRGGDNQSATLTAYNRMGDQDTHPTILDHAGGNDGTVVVDNGNEFVTDVP